MAIETIKTTFKLRRAPQTEWERKNPILAEGEPGWATDVKILKIGDGTTPWNKLKSITGITITDTDGIIFNSTNTANAEAVAFGIETKALGTASIAAGIKKDASDAPEVDSQEWDDKYWRYNEAYGTASIAAGMGAVAYSRASKSLGYRTQTGKPLNEEQRGSRDEADDYGYAEENIGQAAVAIGSDTKALENNSFAGGHLSVANGKMSFAFGSNNTTASGESAMACGNKARAIGDNSVAIGWQPQATQNLAIAIGKETIANQQDQIVLGRYNDANSNPDATFIIGNGTGLAGDGDNTRRNTLIINKDNSVSINTPKMSIGQNAFASGTNSFALGGIDHDGNGNGVKASGYSSIAMGANCVASNYYATALGRGSQSSGVSSVAMGSGSVASGSSAVALGSSTASNYGAFAAGISCEAQNMYSVAMGQSTTATGEASFAMGNSTRAGNHFATAMGYLSQANGYGSIAAGTGVRAIISNSAAFGKYNDYESNNSNTALLTVGNGTSSTNRGDAFIIDTTGNAKAAGTHTSMGADYAEMFEWSDGNPEAEDRIGYAVALEGEQIRLAQPGDDILGIISGTAAVLGDTAAMYWKDKYITDSFGRIIYDMVEEFDEVENPDTHEITKVSLGFFKHPRLNPDYNANEAYIPREQRQEWSKVGMIGKLYARDDGTCVVGGYATIGINGVLTYSMERTNIKVMKRTDDNIVYVLKI